MAITGNLSATLRTKKYSGSALWGGGSVAQQGNWSAGNLVGQLSFSSLALFGRTIAKIEIGFTTASVGSGGSKTLYFYTDNVGSVMSGSDGMNGSRFVGSYLGQLSGITRGGDTILTLQSGDTGTNGQLFNALASYFATGGSSLILYKSTAVSSDDDYLSVTACVIRVTYDVGTVSQPSIERDGVPVSSVPYGGQVTILTNRASSTYHHTLSYTYQNLANAPIIAQNVGASYTWTLPSTIREGLTLTIRCYTYDQSGSLIGSATVQLIVTSAAGSGAPSIGTPAIADVDPAITTTFGGYVRSRSRLNVTLNVTPASGTSVLSVRTTLDGQTYSGTSFTTGYLSEAGSLTMTVTAVGSTGDTATRSFTITVLDYEAPVLSTFTVQRCDSSGLPSNTGTRVLLTAVGSASAMDGHNNVSAKLYFRPAGGSWSSGTTLTVSGGSLSLRDQVVNVGLSASVTSYEFRLDFGDSFVTLQQLGNTEAKKLLGEFINDEAFQLYVPLRLPANAPLAVQYGGTGATSLEGLGGSNAPDIRSGSSYLIVGDIVICWGQAYVSSFRAPTAFTISFASYLPSGVSFASAPGLTVTPMWMNNPSGTAVVSAMIRSVGTASATCYGLCSSSSTALGSMYFDWIAIGKKA